jgi:hypothetical protein
MAKEKKESGGNLEEGLSSKQPIDKAYAPRTSGTGGRPESPSKTKVGKFTIC